MSHWDFFAFFDVKKRVSACKTVFSRQQVSAVTVVNSESATGIFPFDRDTCMGTHYPACSTLQAPRAVKTQFFVHYGKKTRGTRERAWLGLTAGADLLVHFDMRMSLVYDKLVYAQQLFDR